MQQLKMIRYSSPVRLRNLPDGYKYETYSGTDEEINDWIAICQNGLIGPDAGVELFREVIINYPDLEPFRDLFFVLNDNGERIATSASVCHKDGTGYIHMVASLPSTRGKGIGHAMLSHALDIIESRGVRFTVLTTDDFRLAAIKTYLDAGFLPVIYFDSESNMEERWNEVIKNLNYPKPEYVVE